MVILGGTYHKGEGWLVEQTFQKITTFCLCFYLIKKPSKFMFSGLSKISCRTDLVYKWSIVLDFRTKFSFKTEQLFSHIKEKNYPTKCGGVTTSEPPKTTLPLSSVIGVLYICMNCISLLLSNCVFASRSTCFVSVSLFILPFCLCLSILYFHICREKFSETEINNLKKYIEVTNAPS